MSKKWRDKDQEKEESVLVHVWLTLPTECRYTYHPLHQNWMWIFLQLLHSCWNNVHLSNSGMRKRAKTSPWLEMARRCEAEVELPASLLENLWDCRPQCPWASAYPGIGTFFGAIFAHDLSSRMTYGLGQCWVHWEHHAQLGQPQQNRTVRDFCLQYVIDKTWSTLFTPWKFLTVRPWKFYYIPKGRACLPTIIFSVVNSLLNCGDASLLLDCQLAQNWLFLSCSNTLMTGPRTRMFGIKGTSNVGGWCEYTIVYMFRIISTYDIWCIYIYMHHSHICFQSFEINQTNHKNWY